MPQTISLDELISWQFRFGHGDGPAIAERIILKKDGAIAGNDNGSERGWGIENGQLVFKDANGITTTIFDNCRRASVGYVLTGRCLPGDSGSSRALTAVARVNGEDTSGIVSQLLRELYDGDGPLRYAEPDFADNGYPHTNLQIDLVESVLDVLRPRFWLELGSMLGGSAICAANAAKQRGLPTEIVCVDPFTGDVNMWAWERGAKTAQTWQFLRIEKGRPTIWDRFLANVLAAGHQDIILPIAATSIVGMKLLRRLNAEGRIWACPEVIYLDSAHEPEETFLELKHCWDLLAPGGVLMGDDWNWESVRSDVLKFARTITPNLEHARPLIQRHRNFRVAEGILLDRNQWVLVKGNA